MLAADWPTCHSAVAVSNGGDEPGERRNSWHENLALDQACRGQVEQDAGPLRGEPRSRVQPLHQPKVLGLIGEIAIPETLSDLGGTVPPRVAESV